MQRLQLQGNTNGTRGTWAGCQGSTQKRSDFDLCCEQDWLLVMFPQCGCSRQKRLFSQSYSRRVQLGASLACEVLMLMLLNNASIATFWSFWCWWCCGHDPSCTHVGEASCSQFSGIPSSSHCCLPLALQWMTRVWQSWVFFQVALSETCLTHQSSFCCSSLGMRVPMFTAWCVWGPRCQAQSLSLCAVWQLDC